MRKMIILAVGVMALVLPLAAMADTSTPTPSTIASKICTQLKTSMGAATFGATYGSNASKSNAFGKCVSQNAKAATRDVNNATKACTAERANDAAAFATKYGSNGKAGTKGATKNAFGKCVSAAARQAANAQVATIASAAKSCKAALKADASAFATKYGTARNAFGKCVAATAKTK
jgi:hypothetical protein